MSGHRGVPIPFPANRAGKCRWCDHQILREDGEVNRRRAWHPECVEEYRALAYPAEQRRIVFDRDKGVCADCGRDTEAERVAWQTRAPQATVAHYPARGADEAAHAAWRRERDAYEAARRAWQFEAPPGWEVDHEIPLVDGGCQNVLNLVTRCEDCHQRKTSREATERAERRRRTFHDEILRLRALVRDLGGDPTPPDRHADQQSLDLAKE